MSINEVSKPSYENHVFLLKILRNISPLDVLKKIATPHVYLFAGGRITGYYVENVIHADEAARKS